jgi:membrane protease YdiL (CAAX protease family)
MRTQSWHAIVAFVILTFGWSWGIGWAAGGVDAQRILAGFGPSLAGIAVVGFYEGPAGLRAWWSRCIKWQIDWRWFALAFVTPPVLMVAALGIHVAMGGALPKFTATQHIPLAIANFGLVLLVGGPLGEEFGWRGFLTPALTARMNWRLASLMIGVIWGLWHLPLFFTGGTPQAAMALSTFLVNILAGSVLFGWLFQRNRGSVLPVLVLHTSLNAWSGILEIIPTATMWMPYVLLTGLLVLVAIGLLIAPDRDH